MNNQKLSGGDESEREASIRLKKQGKKYENNHVFLFVSFVLSMMLLSLALYDSAPKTELAPPKNISIKKVFVYEDDSLMELEKFSEMETRFSIFNRDIESHKNSVKTKSLKAEKKFGKILDRAQQIHGEGDSDFRDLVKAVMITESGLNYKAFSKKGARGLMGIMPGNFHFLGIKNPFDSSQNILGGAKMLRVLLDKYGGDQSSALAEYNAGASKIKRNYFPTETSNYIVRVEFILKHLNS